MFLNCHSTFSLRYGTMSVEELVEEAIRCGVKELVLTDINNTSACFDFIRECRASDIKPMIGVEIRNKDELCFIAIARNMNGFEEINAWLSTFLRSKRQLPKRAPNFNQVWVIYPPGPVHPDELNVFEFVGIRPEQASRLPWSPWRHHTDKLVIWQPVTFRTKRGYNTHRLLRAIDHNTLLSKLQVDQQAGEGEMMQPQRELLLHFQAWPKIIANTRHLIDSSEVDFKFGVTLNKLSFSEDEHSDRLLLERLSLQGLEERYGKDHPEALSRVERELQIIDKLGFIAYFLITWDIIRFARSQGIRHVGRGSGANSIVAYCLYITDVDPIELDLYFERFINPYRNSPPDFDIDFSWDERDRIYDYIFARYGVEHVALLATYSTFKGRSIIRELGKVFGLPKPEIDRIIQEPNDKYHEDQITRLIFNYGKEIEGLPNHLSIHAGGVLISEKPIYRYTATPWPPKGYPTTQFDMYVSDEIGLFKYDILSQRGLGHIKEAVEIISENRGIDVDVHDIPRFKKDPNINKKLGDADTIGCFYIESPAMRQLLHKLDCRDYLTLVAASSIIRPGVARSGMMAEYIKRHQNPHDFKYLHPKMEELMKETYGIMVYQEDVIKVAHHFAGLDLGEADILRRAMSGKYRSKDGFQRIKSTFFNNCDRKGYARSVTEEVWRQIESFGGYSFSKAHSASFAVESYQSLFLKTYYPLEFMVAVINNFGGFYRTEFYLNEARQAGANILPPCINRGEYLTAIRGKDIYLGFVHVKELERKTVKLMLQERGRAGPYAGLTDFCIRVGVSLEQIQILVRIGAFRSTGISKKRLLWDAQMLCKREKVSTGPPLFVPPVRGYKLPVMQDLPLEDAYDEMELLGFPLRNPFVLLNADIRGQAFADDLPAMAGRRVTITGYYITSKDVRTIRGERMLFVNYLDAYGKSFDTVLFPDVLKKFGMRGSGFYLMKGKVVDEFGVMTLEVEYIRKMGMKTDPRDGE